MTDREFSVSPGTAPVKRKRRTQQQRREETRAALVQATVGALCDLGYARATTSEIARRADVTTGALQHHFSSKEELLVAVLDTVMADFIVGLESFAERNSPGYDAIPKVIRALWMIYSSPGYQAVAEVITGARNDPVLHDLVVEHRNRSLATCEALWADLFGDLGADRVVVRQTLHHALATLRGYSQLGDAKPNGEFLEEQLRLLEAIIGRVLRDAAEAG